MKILLALCMMWRPATARRHSAGGRIKSLRDNEMTFEEWYEQEYGIHPDLIDDIYVIDHMAACRRGWEASRENLRSWDL